jgi:hypothetical protein
MSNRLIVKFSFIAAAFFFASCHNDVPSLPTIEKVQEFKYCKYYAKEKDESGEYKDVCRCKSEYEITDTECRVVVHGEFFEDKESCDAACSVP